MRDIGVYIHIPFCMQKCFYCDFVSFANQSGLEKRYIKALKKEIIDFFNKNKNIKISTIYIGGGTPSYIDANYVKQIIEEIPIKQSNIKEATIEVNPGTVNEEKLKIYKNIGINRLSIGLQSAQDTILKQIGRIHNYNDFLNTYNLAKKVKFENINVDLIIGLPNQTINDIKETLENIVKLNPNHISVYSLIVEDKTLLAEKIKNGELTLPSEDLERNMYWYVKNYLELNSYNHYEISNFAKSEFESKHNLDCWNQKEYVGFGLAAHSYIKNERYSNICDLEQYIINCENNDFNKNKIILETQNKYMQEQEFMLLGLRKIEGVSIKEFKNKFQENPIFIFRNELNKLCNENLVNIDIDKIKLTNKGLDLANLVWEEFV